MEGQETIIPGHKKKESKVPLCGLLGLIFVILYLALSIASLVIAGISFHTLYATWSEGPWKALGPCALAVATTATFVGLVGLVAFIRKTQGTLSFYILIALISLLFSWAISIFALVGVRIHYKVDGMVGCQTKKTGILQMWTDVDTYLQFADSLLCSSQCKCPLPKAIMEEYENDPYAAETYQIWNDEGGVEQAEQLDSFTLADCKHGLNKRYRFNFQSCSKFVRNEAHQRYIEHSNATHHWIKPKQFANYWKRLEKKFNCTGWCQTKYKDTYTGHEKGMFKFIFSDVNKGIPKYPGCMYRVMDWISKMLKAFGGMMNIAAFFQTFAFIIALYLYSKVAFSNQMLDVERHP